jgi:hypothetical protein
MRSSRFGAVSASVITVSSQSVRAVVVSAHARTEGNIAPRANSEENER